MMNLIRLKRPAMMWVALAVGGGVHATEVSDVAALAKENGCYSCHAAHEKVVGPAFVSVAEKYAGQQDAVAEVAMSIQHGSVKKWGRIAMPAHGSLAKEDVQRLAQWVLATRR